MNLQGFQNSKYLFKTLNRLFSFPFVNEKKLLKRWNFHKNQNFTKTLWSFFVCRCFREKKIFTFSISSQLVTIPCSMGYFKVRIPLLDWASSPTYESFCPIPTITPWWRGRPTMDGKTALGASSPANPALHIPDPLSTTRAATSSSAMFCLSSSVLMRARYV